MKKQEELISDVSELEGFLQDGLSEAQSEGMRNLISNLRAVETPVNLKESLLTIPQRMAASVSLVRAVPMYRRKFVPVSVALALLAVFSLGQFDFQSQPADADIALKAEATLVATFLDDNDSIFDRDISSLEINL